jgi:hypothetical protein
MKVRLTTMSGSTKDINFQSREQVMKFLEQLPKDLRVNDRLKVTCDLLGIDGYVQGTA